MSYKQEACEVGCQGRLLISGELCPCLENKMPHTSKRSVKASSIGDIDRFSTPNEHVSSEFDDPNYVRQRLTSYGLENHEVDLLMARYVEEKTLDEIVTGLNWTSKGSAAWHLKAALAKLKKRGFTL